MGELEDRPVTTSFGVPFFKLKEIERIAKNHKMKSRNQLVLLILEKFLKDFEENPNLVSQMLQE